MIDGTAPTSNPPAMDTEKPHEYDAFLSYTHRDRLVAAGIQKGLHQIGRRLGQLRALRVFRDDTDLTVRPDLWAGITEALDRSRFLVVMLSPQAAESRWVNQEIGYWLEHRGSERLLLVLAGGRLQWDARRARFDPQLSDAAPSVLTEPGALPTEPLHVDVSDQSQWDPRYPPLREKITEVAARIHGKPKEQLAQDDRREQRRERRLRNGAVGALAVLTIIAVVAAVIAVVQRGHAVNQEREAIRQRNQATALRLTSEAADVLAQQESGGDARAFEELLAARGLSSNPDEGALLHAAAARAGTVRIIPTGSAVLGVAFSPDGSRIATAEDDASIRIWSSETGRLVNTLTGHLRRVTSVAFGPDGHRLLSGSNDSTVRLWDVDAGRQIGGPLSGHVGPVLSVAFSSDGHVLASAGDDATVRLWGCRQPKCSQRPPHRPYPQRRQCGLQSRRAPIGLRK